MLNRLEPPARLVIRTCLALFTCIVIVLVQSAFWTGAVSGWMRAIMIVIALLAYFRPHHALLALAALTPLAQVGGRTLDSNMRGAEALVLAYFAGALLRGWILHRFRSVPSNAVQLVAFAFAIVVAASCIEQIWFLQVQRHFPAPFYRGLFAYATRRYLIALDSFDMIFGAMLLLEGLVLMLYVVHYCRARVEFAWRLVTALIAGAVAAALVNLRYVVPALLGNDGRGSGLTQLVFGQRWTFHVSDVNAAASFFAMALFMAVGMAWRSGAQRRLWVIAAILIGIAFWLTGSRTGLVAAVIATAVLIAKATLRRSRQPSMVGVIVLLALVASAVLVARFFPASFVDVTASQAVTIRWLFLGTTWRMLVTEPFFGIGIGQYALWSRHFSAPEMFNYYARENAHNYFAQIAGELGLVGLAMFVWVLASALRRAGLAVQDPPYVQPLLFPVSAGLAVFILTWFGGHPLLVAEVSYPFWLALGILPGIVSAPNGRLRHGMLIGLLFCAALAISIPVRVENKSARIDFTRISYGLADRELTSRGRFFVAGGTSRVTIPLRARSATPESPVSLDIRVDERLAATITLTESGWREAEIELRGARPARLHQIDLRIRDRESGSSVEVGDWEIISGPDA